MRAGIVALILFVGALNPALSNATEIEGKWGLGVAIGSLFSSGAEASIIRGRSARTAWIADFAASVSSDHRTSETDFESPFYPDTTIVGRVTSDVITIEVGPRLRRFTNPANSFSAYGDVYVHFIDSARRQTYEEQTFSDTKVGGKLGIAMGVEYFSTRWPFSVGAHTDIVTFSALHASGKANDPYRAQSSSGSVLSGSMTLRPTLQVRVYF